MTRSALASALAAAFTLVLALPAGAQTPPPSEKDIGHLETVVVTAEKREESVQDAPLAVTAVSAASLEKGRILNSEDLAHSAIGLSFTQSSPQALEYSIRGVVNTRLTAPTADQSVSVFADDVYVSRSGSISSNFYDIERVEVIRGPQGVLLGKNVSGGALSIISARPTFENSGVVTLTGGNFDLKQATGYVTGGLTDAWAGRLSFQTLDHGGYAQDLGHNVPLEDLHSQQLRGQLRFDRKDSSFRANLLVEYAKDDSNGPNRVGILSPNHKSPLIGPDLHPWSTARDIIAAKFVPGLTIRESFPVWPTFAGDATPTPQGVHHKNSSIIVKLEGEAFQDVELTSVTGYRHGFAQTFYDQTGLGPDNPYNVDVPFLFAEPVYFQENVDQYSEEVRLTSKYPSSPLDWIAGIYAQQIDVHQFNRFWGEGKYLPTLNGESHWDDRGTNDDYAAFAQVGFKLSDAWKLDVGVRFTHDKKRGTQAGTAVATGDKYVPNDPRALTPLQSLCFRPDNSVVSPTPAACNPPNHWIYSAGTGFLTPYGASWSKTTPQATLTFKPNDALMAYLTVSEGYKGGGFLNDAPSDVAASTPYQPESVRNYELGVKLEFLDKRARWNTAVFYEDYTDLQVQQTNAQCLCNIIANAKAATIKGVETEFQIRPVRALYLFLGGTYLKDRYTDFTDPITKVSYNGNVLQRTPNYQATLGGEVTTDAGSWPDALHFRVTYKHQGTMYWAQTNATSENPYGLLDARITLAPKDARWNASLWGKNLVDKVYRTNIIEFFGLEMSSFGAPRTLGLDVGIKF
jgi:iron complex outermembrane recepter protein